MAKQNYYYVLVFTTGEHGGPVYVTSIDYKNKMSRWDKSKPPKRFTMHGADDLVFGLRCNGFQAVTVKAPVVIDYQPYRYEAYEIEWKKVEGTEK